MGYYKKSHPHPDLRRHATAACLRLLRHQQRTLMGDCAGSAGAKRRERRLSPDNNLFPPHLLADIAQACATSRVADRSFSDRTGLPAAPGIGGESPLPTGQVSHQPDMSRLAAFADALQAYAHTHPASVAPENPWLTRQACAAILREARCSHFAEPNPEARLRAHLAQGVSAELADHFAKRLTAMRRQTPASDTYPAQVRHAEALFAAATDPADPASLFPVETLADMLVAATALGLGQAARDVQTASFAEPDPAWADTARRFLAKTPIPAREMEDALRAADDAVAQGLLPRHDQAYRRAYENAFTMVREANEQVLTRARDVLARGLQGAGNATDLRLDLDDLYRSAGLHPQTPWYGDLVVHNNMNRAWADARDSIAWQRDAGGNVATDAQGEPEYADWLWGFEWVLGNVETEHRPTHLAMRGHTAPKDDPVWKTFYPHCAHNCHCTYRHITVEDARQRGLVGREHPTPTLDAAALRGHGLGDEEISRLEGLPVDEALLDPALRGDRFPRTRFDIHNRSILNPTGAQGLLPELGEKVLDEYPDTGALLNAPWLPPQGAVRAFTSPHHAAQYGAAHWSAWAKSLPDPDLAALRIYKADDKDESYKQINRVLRREAAGQEVPEQYHYLVDQIVPQIDRALAQTSTPEPIMVYRALDFPELNDVIARGEWEGYVFREPAYMSTAMHKAGAEAFLEDAPVIMRLHVPAGTPAAYLDLDKIQVKGEYELLITRGTRYRITDVKSAGKKMEVEAELLP